MKRFILCFSVIFVVTALPAQQNVKISLPRDSHTTRQFVPTNGLHPSGSEIKTKVRPTVKTNSPLSTSSGQLDLGTVDEKAGLQSHRIFITNIADSAISVYRITTSCGCIKARQLHDEPIAPSATDTIVLDFNPLNMVGTIDSRVYVYTDAGLQPALRIDVVGMVTSDDLWRHLPKQLGPLRLKTTRLRFTDVKPATKPTLSIMCANSGAKPLRLSALMLPRYASFATQPEVLQPGEEGELVVTLNTDLMPAQRPLHFTFLLEGIKATRREITVSIEE